MPTGFAVPAGPSDSRRHFVHGALPRRPPWGAWSALGRWGSHQRSTRKPASLSAPDDQRAASAPPRTECDRAGLDAGSANGPIPPRREAGDSGVPRGSGRIFEAKIRSAALAEQEQRSCSKRVADQNAFAALPVPEQQNKLPLSCWRSCSPKCSTPRARICSFDAGDSTPRLRAIGGKVQDAPAQQTQCPVGPSWLCLRCEGSDRQRSVHVHIRITAGLECRAQRRWACPRPVQSK